MKVLNDNFIYAPPLPGVRIPKTFRVKIPEGKKPGDEIIVAQGGKKVRVLVPNVMNPATGKSYKPGEYITWSEPGETEKATQAKEAAPGQLPA